MDRGELLGDDLIMEMVSDRLAESDTKDRGFILDGCPRTVAQARMLADLLAPVDLDLVIDIEVPTSQVLRRLAVAPGVRRLRRQLLPPVPPADRLDVRRLRRRGGPARGRHRGGHLASARDLRGADRAAHRLVPGPGPAGPGGRHRHARRRSPSGSSGPSRTAGTARADGSRDPGPTMTGMSARRARPTSDAHGRDRSRPGRPMRRNADELAKMRKAGRVVAEIHEATRAVITPRRHHLRHRQGRPGGAREAGRGLQLPRLPRVPGGGVHVAQLHDRPRHPLEGRRPRRGRHHLRRLRGDHRGLPRRRRLHGAGGGGLGRGRPG